MSWSYRTPARTLLDSLSNLKKLKICILGAGAVGTSFAVYLAVAGHDVTLVARGARLDKLTRDGGVIATSPPTTPTPARVTVATAVDPTCAWDLVLVTVSRPPVRRRAPRRAQVVPGLHHRRVHVQHLCRARRVPQRRGRGAVRVWLPPIIQAQFVEPDSA